MKTIFTILFAAAVATSCSKEQQVQNGSESRSTCFNEEETYSSLIGEWKVTNVKNHMEMWHKTFKSFVVSRTHIDGQAYTIIGEDKIQRADNEILEFLFTRDTTYVYFPITGEQQKWSN